MISRITGTFEQQTDNALVLRVGGVSYEVFIPASVLSGLSGLAKGAEVSLVTYHYYQTDPSKSIPILIGFSNQIEKDFFERFITVSGVGPKAALKALKPPIAEIAEAIDAGDLAFLKSLPGIGEQRAKEIIAKLQGKMGHFALIRSSGATRKPGGKAAIEDEAVEVLLQLQYRKEEAREMIRKALERRPDAADSEELLNEVYRQKKGHAQPKQKSKA